MTLKHEEANKELILLNEQIKKTEMYLNSLFKNRAGLILWNNSDEAEVGWCSACGKQTVNAITGEDICYSCIDNQ